MKISTKILLFLLALFASLNLSSIIQLNLEKAHAAQELYRPAVFVEEVGMLDTGKAVVVFRWSKPANINQYKESSGGYLSEDSLHWRLNLKGPDGRGNYKEHNWNYGYNTLAVHIVDEVKLGGQYTSMLELVEGDPNSDSAKVLGFSALTFSTPADQSPPYPVGKKTSGECSPTELEAWFEHFENANRKKLHISWKPCGTTGSPVFHLLKNGTEINKGTAASTMTNGRKYFSLNGSPSDLPATYRVVQFDTVRGAATGYAEIEINRNSVNPSGTTKRATAPEGEGGADGSGEGTTPGGEEVPPGEETGGGEEEAQPNKECDKGGLWEKITDPLGRAIQYMQCIILTGVQDAIDNLLEFVFKLIDFSKVDDLPSYDKLAFWKIDTAHASLSSKLNPDPAVGDPGEKKLTYIIGLWDTLRAFINIFLVFMIIFLSFANIFRIDVNKYAVKKALPGLILGVLLANFSGMICRAILDIAEMLFMFVTGGNPGGVYSEAIRALSLARFLGLFTGSGVAVAVFFTLSQGIGIAIFILTALTMTVGVMIPFLIMIFALALRTGIMIALFGISPLAFLCLGSPLTSKLFTRWWEEEMRWAFMPTVMFFLVFLAAQIAKG